MRRRIENTVMVRTRQRLLVGCALIGRVPIGQGAVWGSFQELDWWRWSGPEVRICTHTRQKICDPDLIHFVQYHMEEHLCAERAIPRKFLLKLW